MAFGKAYLNTAHTINFSFHIHCRSDGLVDDLEIETMQVFFL